MKKPYIVKSYHQSEKTFGKDKGKESGIKLAKKKLGMAIRSVLGEGKGRDV